jgi:hypothetical protein
MDTAKDNGLDNAEPRSAEKRANVLNRTLERDDLREQRNARHAKRNNKSKERGNESCTIR